MKALTLFLIAGCAVSEPPPEPPAARPADGDGPYAVGATTRSFVDARGVTLTVEVWYPATPEADAVPEAYGELSVARAAYRDAPPDRRGAPYPLVAFSHGNGGIRYQSTFLTERLASHGFVVVAPDHPRNTLLDYDADAIAEVGLARPGDVSAVVDFALALPEGDALVGLVEDDGFAMVGHSFGAWTSLLVGGGVVDVAATVAHCAETPTPGCDFFTFAPDADVSVTVPDPRVRVVTALAPGAWFTFGATGLADVAAPLVIGGRLDEDLPYDSEIRPSYEALGAPKAIATLERTGHWSFTDLCELVPLIVDCTGEAGGYTDPARVRAWTNTLVTAHLRVAFGLAPDDAAWLSAAAWAEEPDLTWEAAP